MEMVQDISHCSDMGQQSSRLNASEKKHLGFANTLVCTWRQAESSQAFHTLVRGRRMPNAAIKTAICK